MNQGSGGILAVAIIVAVICFGMGEFGGLDDAKEFAHVIPKAVR